jgi:hypothetical protein
LEILKKIVTNFHICCKIGMEMIRKEKYETI